MNRISRTREIEGIVTVLKILVSEVQSRPCPPVIAHRPTARDTHAIVVLDEAQVVEVGHHADLLTRGGFYAHLVARQLAAGAGAVLSGP